MKRITIVLFLFIGISGAYATDLLNSSPCKDGGAYRIHKSASSILRMARADTVITCESDPDKLVLARERRLPYPKGNFVLGYEVVQALSAKSYAALFTRSGEIKDRNELVHNSDNVSIGPFVRMDYEYVSQSYDAVGNLVGQHSKEARTFRDWHRHRERVFFFEKPHGRSVCAKNQYELKFAEATHIEQVSGLVPRHEDTTKVTSKLSFSERPTPTGFCVNHDHPSNNGIYELMEKGSLFGPKQSTRYFADVQDYWVTDYDETTPPSDSFDLLVGDSGYHDIIRVDLKTSKATRFARLKLPVKSLAELRCEYPQAMRFGRQRDRVFFYFFNEEGTAWDELPPRLLLAKVSPSNTDYRYIFGAEPTGDCTNITMQPNYVDNIEILRPDSANGINVRGPFKRFYY